MDQQKPIKGEWAVERTIKISNNLQVQRSAQAACRRFSVDICGDQESGARREAEPTGPNAPAVTREDWGIQPLGHLRCPLGLSKK
jgi:hypothetical protein